MRPFILLLCAAAVAVAESHPAWWGFASPDATALVGIRWDNLRQSAFADAVSAELSGSGNLGFPDLPCLKDAKQILLSSPALLGIVAGNFPAPALRAEATGKGLKPAVYRDVQLWISPGKTTLSIAQVSEQLLLVGLRKTLEAAIDRSLTESRRYSPLLARAAHFAQTQDLWVLATRLPEPLASLFVPVDADAQSFEGGISVRDGLRLEAVLDAGSKEAAAEIAEKLRQGIPGMPAIARGLEVTAANENVLIAMQVNRDQLSAGLRTVSAAPAAPIRVEEPPKPGTPQIVRILGLDEGPREFVLPPVKQ